MSVSNALAVCIGAPGQRIGLFSNYLNHRAPGHEFSREEVPRKSYLYPDGDPANLPQSRPAFHAVDSVVLLPEIALPPLMPRRTGFISAAARCSDR